MRYQPLSRLSPLLAFCLALTACGGGGGSAAAVPVTPSLTLYQPVQMSATWAGGATGNPTTFTATTPNAFPGPLCPPSVITLQYGLSNATSGYDPTGLIVGDSCTQALSLYVCSFNGSPSTAPGGLSPCAVNPLQTNFSVFRNLGYAGPTALSPTAIDPLPANPSILIFYCSANTTFTAPPLSSAVGCLG